jgi:hypothetical protein
MGKITHDRTRIVDFCVLGVLRISCNGGLYIRSQPTIKLHILETMFFLYGLLVSGSPILDLGVSSIDQAHGPMDLWMKGELVLGFA